MYDQVGNRKHEELAMKNKNVKKWASIAEIAGTVAVIISLAFVVQSIDQNTKAIEAAESNNIWAAWREVGVLPIINNPEFAAVYAKARNSEDLSVAEQVQWNMYRGAQFDIWAQLFDLYKDDLMSQEKWDYWDNGYWSVWEQNRLGETWESAAEMFDPDFQQHVNSRRTELGMDEQ